MKILNLQISNVHSKLTNKKFPIWCNAVLFLTDKIAKKFEPDQHYI